MFSRSCQIRGSSGRVTCASERQCGEVAQRLRRTAVVQSAALHGTPQHRGGLEIEHLRRGERFA
jgi:hypothetical protein